MPTFRLDKLVRDGFRNEYESSGQKVIYKDLTLAELKSQLVRKIAEEANEIPILQGQISDVVGEIADIQQAINDLMAICHVDRDSVEVAMDVKHNKLGGFATGLFIESIELREDDEWTDYYRGHPERFPEIK